MQGDRRNAIEALGARGWPPADLPAGDYRPIPVAGSEPLAAVRIGAAGGAGGSVGAGTLLAVARATDGGLIAAPLVAAADGGWRVAGPGDGAAAAVVATLGTPGPAERDLGAGFRLRRDGDPLAVGPGRERPVGGDQTNRSIVVDERIVVKAILRPDAASGRAAALRRHLAAVGFGAAPALAGTVEWLDDDGGTVTVALADAFLPGLRDGWEAYPDALLAAVGDAGVAAVAATEADAHELGERLGRLTAALHLALATATAAEPAPVGEAPAATLERWRTDGLATLDEAIELTAADDAAAAAALRRWAPGLAERIGSLATVGRTAVQPIHGDLHVGQLPPWRDGTAVIDFDGNPTLPAAARLLPAPAARDLAQLRCSLDHVARIALRRLGEATPAQAALVERWSGIARGACLAAHRATLAAAGRGGLLDERLLPAFEAEQECRELVYAARHLPRWRYAPLGAIRAMIEG
ncbi:MAG: hypothetical protein RL338_1581 [Chloroflexota bacterium]